LDLGQHQHRLGQGREQAMMEEGWLVRTALEPFGQKPVIPFVEFVGPHCLIHVEWLDILRRLGIVDIVQLKSVAREIDGHAARFPSMQRASQSLYLPRIPSRLARYL
jgi:hypothetical protein